ncbi:MAG: hypothetical protein U7123_20345 [Potamolinea sp.]
MLPNIHERDRVKRSYSDRAAKPCLRASERASALLQADRLAT